MITKSIDDLRTDLKSAYNKLLPKIDLTEGSPEADMFVEAQIAGNLQSSWTALAYSQMLQAPLTYYSNLSDDDIIRYCGTFGVIQGAATYSTGQVTFYTTSEPTSDIAIESGTTVSTIATNPATFSVVGNYIMYASIASSYYNINTSRWEIACDVQGTEAGPDYRAGSGTVVRLITPITGITGCINSAAISGGTAIETTQNMLKRVHDKFQGRDLGPDAGIKSYLSVYTRDINIVGANNPLMLRDEGLGGMIDIYVIGEDLISATDEVTITSTGLLDGINVSFTETSIVLINQPVHSIANVSKNGVVLDTTYYQLTEDTGLLKKSTASEDKIELTSTGITAIGYFADQDDVVVTYNYNNFLTTIQDDIDSSQNHFQDRDYLIREMNAVTINFYMKFVEESGQDWESIASTLSTSISDFIDNIKTEGSVEAADIVGLAKNTGGVDNIDLTTISLTNIDGGTKVGQDIYLGSTEYPIPGTMTIAHWTNA
jgi:uncharacterized phage protein gp47/JayE